MSRPLLRLAAKEACRKRHNRLLEDGDLNPLLDFGATSGKAPPWGCPSSETLLPQVAKSEPWSSVTAEV